MKTKEERKEFWLEIGNKPTDIEQLEHCFKTVICDIEGKRIGRHALISIIGEEDFLCGVSRCAFHRTAGRGTPDGREIGFYYPSWGK